MKLYAPSYYLAFTCIADKCRHSCCIGWEIDVDPQTLDTYQTMTHPYGETVRKSISYRETPHFRLGDKDRCPHLNDHGLCNIILHAGEGYLCEICREHPRFYHETAGGREVGLGMACEEACRLILSWEDYCTFIPIDEDGEEAEPVFFDTLPHREKLYAILSDTTVPYSGRVQAISRAWDVTPLLLPDGEWRTLLASLEYLHEEHRTLFACFSSASYVPPSLESSMERFLAYLIFRHLTPAWDEADFRAALGFCLFCHQLLASMLHAYPEQSILHLARILSEEIEYSPDNTDTIKTVF